MCLCFVRGVFDAAPCDTLYVGSDGASAEVNGERGIGRSYLGAWRVSRRVWHGF
jgi:hypothetical protein